MRIDDWTAVENLKFDLGSYFEHIREDAEMQNTEDYEFVFDYVEMLLKKDFPQLFVGYSFDDVVNIEYCPFEKYEDDPDDYIGYAVYISFHKTLVKKMYKKIFDEYPEYVLLCMDELV